MTDENTTERGPASMSLAAAASTGFGGASGFDLAPKSLGEVVGFAKLMAGADHAIPKHLRQNPGACMAVTLQALGWEMSPFAVAQKTYKVGDTIAYEAQVIAAVINSRAGLKHRPAIEYTGEGQTRRCIVTLTFRNGDVRDYTSPELGSIKVKNSPLWQADPDQQLSYFSLRSAARRHCPEVILGVLDRDEVENAEPMRDVTPVQGTGMAERLAARAVDVQPEAFNIRAPEAEVLPPETAEPKKRAPRKAKEPTALEAIAEAEPEIVQQVVEDHGGVGNTDATAEADFQPVEPQEAVSAAVVVQDGPAPSGEPYFHADKEAFPSGRRVAYIDGVAQADTPEDGTLPVYAEHAALAPAQDEAQTTDSELPETAAVEDEKPAAVEDQAGFDTPPTDPFDIFDAALAEARDWPTLRPAMLALSHTPEWQARPDMRNNVRIDVWEVVSAWNDAGAKIDPADDALLFQAYLATSQDVEAIEGLYETAKVMHWLISASDGMKQGVAKFVANRVEEVKRGLGA